MKSVVKLLIAASAIAVFSGSAMAADLYVPPKAAPALAPAPTSGWDGLYIGGHVGYGWENLADPTSFWGNGWTVGGQIGYNAHLTDQLVGGVEGNLDWANEAGTSGGESYAINWDGSVRARLGLDMGQWLPYAEVGVAFANAEQEGGAYAVRTGWTAGAGVEVMLASNVSANLEYRYSNYGAGSGGTTLTDNAILIGLNYHF